MKQQRPEPRTLIGQPPQRSKEHLPDAYSGPERDQYASRALAYVILLNGVAALILVTSLAFAPQSASDPRRLTWAMLVFGSGALAGLLSSLLAYIGRTAIASSYLIVQDVLRREAHSFFRLPLLPRLRRALIVVCPAELLSLSSLCVT